MQWMWRCCLHTALLIATCEKGPSENVAMPALIVCNQIGSVKQSTVFGRVDGLAIPWLQKLQPRPAWKNLHYSWAYKGSVLERSGNWAYGSTSSLTRLVIRGSAVKPGLSLTRSWKKRTCISVCRFSARSMPARHPEPHQHAPRPTLTKPPTSPHISRRSTGSEHHPEPQIQTRPFPLREEGDARAKPHRSRLSRLTAPQRRTACLAMMHLITWLDSCHTHCLHGEAAAPTGTDLSHDQDYWSQVIHDKAGLRERKHECVADPRHTPPISLAYSHGLPSLITAVRTPDHNSCPSLMSQAASGELWGLRSPKSKHVALTGKVLTVAHLTSEHPLTQLALRRTPNSEATLRAPQPVHPQGARTHISIRLHCPASRPDSTKSHVSAAGCWCNQCLCRSNANFVRADGTMRKPSEEQPPREGGQRDRAQQQPRSRFRADGGELKKRAPYVHYCKGVQARQRQRDWHPPQVAGPRTFASTRMRTRLRPWMGELSRTDQWQKLREGAPGRPGLTGVGTNKNGKERTDGASLGRRATRG